MKRLLLSLALLILAPFARAADPVPTGGLGVNLSTGALLSPKGAGSISLADPAFGGTLPDARLSALAQSSAQRTATLSVDSVRGNDTTAVRGTTLPYASLTAAMAAAQSNDTISIRPGTYAAAIYAGNQTLHVIGAGVNATTVVLPDQCAWQLGSGSTVEGITFDTQITGSAAASRDTGTGFLGLSGANYHISDCAFHGISTTAIYGVPCSSSTFERLTFNNDTQAIFIDSASTTQVPANLHFADIDVLNSTQSGIIIHCQHGLQYYSSGSTVAPGTGPAGSTVITGAPGLSSGLWFTRVNLIGNANTINNSASLGIEVWHGWQNVHFTDCYADSFYFDYSVALCSDVSMSGCYAGHAGFGVEMSDAWNMHILGGTFYKAIATDNGTAHDNSIASSTFVDTTCQLYGSGSVGDTQGGAFSCKVIGNYFKGSLLYIQHHPDVTAEGNTFEPAEDGTQVGGWIVLDSNLGPLDNNVPPVIKNTVIRANAFLGGVTGTGISGVGSGTYAHLIVADNFTDGANGGGAYWNMGNVSVVDGHFRGNITAIPNATYPLDSNFPNDPPGAAYDDSTFGGVPANNELTGSTQFVVTSPSYWAALLNLTASTTTATGTSASYAVSAGDTLEYDIWNDLGNPENRWFVDGVMSDGGYLRDETGNGLTDQNGLSLSVSTAPYSTGRWYHRVVPIGVGTAVGKSVATWEFNVGGGNGPAQANTTCTTYLRRVIVTNAGTLKAFVSVSGISGSPAGTPGLSYACTPRYQTMSAAERATVDAITVPTGNTLNIGTGGTLGSAAFSAMPRVITGTLSAGTVTISDASITSNSRCYPTNTLGPYGSPNAGALFVSAQASGSVTITSSNAAATNPISVTIEN